MTGERALPELAKPDPAQAAAVPAAGLPDWYPPWAKELADRYLSGTTAVFVLHGNVHDLVWCAAEGDDPETYCGLAEFLSTRMFGSWDVVLQYDLGRGLRPLAGRAPARLQQIVKHTAAMGEPRKWPRDPAQVLHLLDRYLERTLLEEGEGQEGPKSVAVVFRHAQYLLPAADISSLAHHAGAHLVRFLGWAQNPYLKRRNIAFCLVADKLSEVNSRLVANPYVAAIEIPMPDTQERGRFARWAAGTAEFAGLSDYGPDELAEVSNGLSLVDLNLVLAQAKRGRGRVDETRFKRLKKVMIERQCHGLLEFFEPKHSLDMVVGHEAAKKRLRDDAALINDGQLDYAPMGYLICGPVGTGKTFLAECYAGSIGIPCVKLRNFRSKYVGETEGNLEHVLTVLRSLGPVVVIIDEADAALGDREASGDSGTSSRVFSMIASQMGDTRYRGRILWMLLTSRPDLLPVDLKRQGRAEVHIPLFYPESEEEFRSMFTVMARKNKVPMVAGAADHLEPDDRGLSGSDIESVVLGAHRRTLAAGRAEVTREDIDGALGDFVPSAQGLERQMQELAAVLECTQLSYLPERHRKQVARRNGRTALQERFAAIRQILEQ